MSEWIFSAAAGALTAPFLWKILDWMLNRQAKREDTDRAMQAEQIQSLWDELNRVKAEHADLREKVASLPTKSDIQRLEERLEHKVNDVSQAIIKIHRQYRNRTRPFSSRSYANKRPVR